MEGSEPGEQTTNGEQTPTEDVPKLNGTSLKSILKVKSERILKNVDVESLPDTPTLESPPPTTTLDDVTLVPTEKPPRKKVHGLATTTTLSYENPAFDADAAGSGESVNTDQHLSDVVEKVIINRGDAHDWHPYGRTSMYEEVLSGKHKSGIFESEKIILWFVFTIILVGMAGGIIFLSETYTFTAPAEETTTSSPCNRTI